MPKAGGLIINVDCGGGSGGAEKTGIVFRIVTGGAILLCGLQCRTGIYGGAPAAGNLDDGRISFAILIGWLGFVVLTFFWNVGLLLAGELGRLR